MHLLFEKGNCKRLFSRQNFIFWLFLLCLGGNIFSAYNKQLAFRTYIDLALIMFCIYNIFSRPYQEEDLFFYSKIVAIFSFIVSFWGIMEVLAGSDFLYEYFCPILIMNVISDTSLSLYLCSITPRRFLPLLPVPGYFACIFIIKPKAAGICSLCFR